MGGTHRTRRCRPGVCGLVRSACLALLVALAGCDSSGSPTSPGDGGGAGASSFTGLWAGSTSQGQPLSFTVGGETGALTLTAFEFNLELTDSVGNPDVIVVCLGGSSGSFGLSTSDGLGHSFDDERTFHLRLPEDVPLVAGGLGGGFVEFAGTLETANRATGTLVAEAPLPLLPAGCLFRGEATWTVER